MRRRWILPLLAALLIPSALAMPQPGQRAPDFKLPSTEGETLSLQNFKGKWLVLYFYPEDFTMGCTIQARRFQQNLTTFQKLNTQIVGVSQDDLATHKGFCTKEGLTFPLLSDSLGTVGLAYGAPGGARNTYIIDPQGILRRAFVGVNPLTSSADTLTALKELQKKTGS